MQIFIDFLILQIFMGFMQGYESSKDKWYKLPLVGVLPKLASGSLWLNGSMPSTPHVAATATAPYRGFFR